MPTCKSCGAEIVWARSSASGKPFPVDAEPTDTGNVRLEKGKATVLSRGQLQELSPLERGTLHLSHFATCPNARDHRTRR